MKTAESFFKWAYDTRGKTVMALNNGEEISKEKMFLSFCSHDPAFVSNGPAGLNASIKGIGFLPKPEYLVKGKKKKIKFCRKKSIFYLLKEMIQKKNILKVFQSVENN